MNRKKTMATLFAILAAVFYAVNMPCSKLLLRTVPSTLMAGFLYLGAGVGIGCIFLITFHKTEKSSLLSRTDFPYTIGMIALDIIAPILLMYGLQKTTSANASLLNNFEIAATTVIAFVIFKEAVSKKLWVAIALVTLSSMVLSFEDFSALRFSWGSLSVLAAAVCWGLENNCTRKISSKNVYEIVTVKGICSGIGSLVIGFFIGEKIPAVGYIFIVLLLGFVAYGLSILFYIKAQKELGAAKTSAYYAIAPFVGVILSFIFLKEAFSEQYFIALGLMIVGSVIITVDTLQIRRNHTPANTVTNINNDSTHTQ